MTYSNSPIPRSALSACWRGTSALPPNLRLGSDACLFFQIAKTIWPALHPKGKHSYCDVKQAYKTTELAITGHENIISSKRKYMLFSAWNSDKKKQ